MQSDRFLKVEQWIRLHRIRIRNGSSRLLLLFGQL